MKIVGEMPLNPGTVIAGKYRIERVLGQGGMGVVAAAIHLQLDQRVALKLMLPHAVASRDAVSRFLREARAAASISSEHVARVFDVGALDTGEPYIAMEYLEGCDIAALLGERGCLTPAEAVDYLLQACEALAEAHAVGIVHRDLKPGNLFLVRRIDGQLLIKVLDFGISKMSGGAKQSSASATLTSTLMGSPLYMSPEQMGSAKHVDARSDVWALGVVLYEMLSGAAPFNGETLPQVCAMVMTKPPVPLQARKPGLPTRLYEVVDRCLEKDPADRFCSVGQLALALEPIASPRARQSIERILRVQNLSAPTIELPAPLVATDSTGSLPQLGTYAPWGETKPPRPKERRAIRVGLALPAAGVLAAAAWVALRPAGGAADAASLGATAAAASTAFTDAPKPSATSSAPISERVSPSVAPSSSSDEHVPLPRPIRVRPAPVAAQPGRATPSVSSERPPPQPVPNATAPATTPPVSNTATASARRSRL